MDQKPKPTIEQLQKQILSLEEQLRQARRQIKELKGEISKIYDAQSGR